VRLVPASFCLCAAIPKVDAKFDQSSSKYHRTIALLAVFSNAQKNRCSFDQRETTRPLSLRSHIRFTSPQQGNVTKNLTDHENMDFD
jgi:hypothetical protein